MKAKRAHRVPLCDRALEVVAQAEALRGGTASSGSGLVFPSGPGKALSNMMLSKLVKEQGIAAVPHGFGRRSGTGPRRERIIRASWSRRRSRTSSGTGSKRPTRAPTCSSAGGGSWSSGRCISAALAPDGDRGVHALHPVGDEGAPDRHARGLGARHGRRSAGAAECRWRLPRRQLADGGGLRLALGRAGRTQRPAASLYRPAAPGRRTYGCCGGLTVARTSRAT